MTAATNGHIVHLPDDIWVCRTTVEWYRQGKPEELGEKLVSVPLCPPQIPHGLTRARTRASAVRGQRLTAWVTARPRGRKKPWLNLRYYTDFCMQRLSKSRTQDSTSPCSDFCATTRNRGCNHSTTTFGMEQWTPLYCLSAGSSGKLLWLMWRNFMTVQCRQHAVIWKHKPLLGSIYEYMCFLWLLLLLCTRTEGWC
jgi:hypothetical protein